MDRLQVAFARELVLPAGHRGRPREGRSGGTDRLLPPQPRKLTKRCISHSGAKVTVKFSNTTAKTAQGQFGVTCAGSGGQEAKALKDGTIPGYDTFSKSYQCPKGFRDHATGWQMSNGKAYRTPAIKL
ncbi:hypothetical protein [Streptomyces rishiriensis]|uniref:Uncharacterized protein n=1 Tax=Streptomyces rishiriensis TaxID=68264 RepID=A0ABU0NI54_STRRH|nr:hypothetical protein [Streptomyces rishiriensis]MDQ0578796.1 hypothetical protein [Streptomyces rishiriensis]